MLAVKEKTVVKKTRRQGIECVANLEDYLDRLINGQVKSTRVPTLFSSLKEAKVLIEFATAKLEKLETDKEYYKKESYDALKAGLIQLLKTLEASKSKLKIEETKKLVRSIKSPSVVAKNVLFCKELVNFNGIRPEEVVGRKKVYVYDIKGKSINCFVSTDSGFTWSGTTLKNLDVEKSSKKKLKNPEQFLASVQFTMPTLNIAYSRIITTPKEVSPRFNENMLIMAI